MYNFFSNKLQKFSLENCIFAKISICKEEWENYLVELLKMEHFTLAVLT